MNFSISVIIPNYNGKELLKAILPSVIDELKIDNIDNEIIVVDDNSTDDSVDYLTQNFKTVKILQNKINKGFSDTVNAGICVATNDLVFILNNDVKLLPGYFKWQLPFFDAEDTFGVNGTVLDWDSDNLQGGGKIINRHLFKIKANKNYFIEKEAIDDRTNYLTMFLSGTNSLIDRKKILLLKGYDELFRPFYVEDVELSIRAMRMGWKMYYAPKSKCMHQVSTTIKKHNKKKKIDLLTLRNKFYLHYKHLNGHQLLFWYLQTFIEVVFRTFTLKFIYLKAFTTFLGSFNNAKKSKVIFNNLLKASRAQKASLFTLLKCYKKSVLELL